MVVDLNVALALLTAIGSTGAMIFYGGRQVGKVEAAISRLSVLESALKDVPLLKTDVEILKNMFQKQVSDFKNLRNKVETVDKEQVEIRVKLASQHDT